MVSSKFGRNLREPLLGLRKSSAKKKGPVNRFVHKHKEAMNGQLRWEQSDPMRFSLGNSFSRLSSRDPFLQRIVSFNLGKLMALFRKSFLYNFSFLV